MVVHYFEGEKTLQFDVYSCREYDLKKMLGFIDGYWHIHKAEIICIDRAKKPVIKEFVFRNKTLMYGGEMA